MLPLHYHGPPPGISELMLFNLGDLGLVFSRYDMLYSCTRTIAQSFLVPICLHMMKLRSAINPGVYVPYLG